MIAGYIVYLTNADKVPECCVVQWSVAMFIGHVHIGMSLEDLKHTTTAIAHYNNNTQFPCIYTLYQYSFLKTNICIMPIYMSRMHFHSNIKSN